MGKFNQRQLSILEFIRKNKKASNQKIRDYLQDRFDSISRVTIVRDLDKLAKYGLIQKSGQGRNVHYTEKVRHPLLCYIDVEEYFKKEPDERELAYPHFNFKVFNDWPNVFTKEELRSLRDLNKQYQRKIKQLSPAVLKKEIERLTIELSWKSSRIEGNTYSLIDTEILIKENKEARGHKREEAVMILNHKKTWEYILSNQADFRKMSLRKIDNIHRLLIKDLGISYNFRKGLVGIVGTKFKPLGNQHQIREAMEKTIDLVNSIAEPFTKALIVILMIAYIQPFEDGNKRTSRLAANAVLMAHNICPLSFRSVNEADYKRAVVLFYEQNSARFFKELFIQQFEFAVNNYF